MPRIRMSDMSIDHAPARASGACDEPLAVHDLAALREGRLPPRRIPRLAQHVARCVSCQILVATIVAESTRVESTGTHAATRRERREPELRAASEDQRSSSR